MIESNLARSSDYDWLQNMARRGYDLVLYFLCTSDVNINVNRVAWRVKEGGHDIPVEIILHRYAMGLTYLKGKMHLFQEVYLVDNSTDEAIEVAQVLEGKLKESAPELPAWAEEVLFIVKRRK